MASPQAGGGGTLIAAGDGIEFVHSRCIHDFELKAGGAAEPVLTVEQRCDPATLMGGWHIKTSSVAIRMTLLDRLDSLFPTDLRTCEDYELFWRAVTLARRIGFSGEPDTVIASTPTSLSREDAMVLPRIMDNIEAMSRVIHWLDGLARRAGPARAAEARPGRAALLGGAHPADPRHARADG